MIHIPFRVRKNANLPVCFLRRWPTNELGRPDSARSTDLGRVAVTPGLLSPDRVIALTVEAVILLALTAGWQIRDLDDDPDPNVLVILDPPPGSGRRPVRLTGDLGDTIQPVTLRRLLQDLGV